MLVDEVIIKIKAGNGGNGAVHFRREKFVPKGGPDGGDGGKGGDIYFVGVEDIFYLNQFRFKKEFFAQDGKPGRPNRKRGISGKDFEIKVPVGTVIKDLRTNQEWEILQAGEKILIAQGGKGGRGNWHFKSPINQTPKEFEKGQKGQERELLLELRLIADIGLVGLPSVGKTSLLNSLTASHAKTGAYFFTTLEPNLGALDNKIIIADLPGIIENAHLGKGLGIKFLKHIQRTKFLVYCISADSPDPVKDYQIIRKELELYKKELVNKPGIILITKVDLVPPQTVKKIKSSFQEITSEREILSCSVYDEKSLFKLKNFLMERVGKFSQF